MCIFLFVAGKYIGKRTDVFISLFINRVSAVDESKEVSTLLCNLCILQYNVIRHGHGMRLSRQDPGYTEST